MVFHSARTWRFFPLVFGLPFLMCIESLPLFFCPASPIPALFLATLCHRQAFVFTNGWVKCSPSIPFLLKDPATSFQLLLRLPAILMVLDRDLPPQRRVFFDYLVMPAPPPLRYTPPLHNSHLVHIRGPHSFRQCTLALCLSIFHLYFFPQPIVGGGFWLHPLAFSLKTLFSSSFPSSGISCCSYPEIGF